MRRGHSNHNIAALAPLNALVYRPPRFRARRPQPSKVATPLLYTPHLAAHCAIHNRHSPFTIHHSPFTIHPSSFIIAKHPHAARTTVASIRTLSTPKPVSTATRITQASRIHLYRHPATHCPTCAVTVCLSSQLTIARTPRPLPFPRSPRSPHPTDRTDQPGASPEFSFVQDHRDIPFPFAAGYMDSGAQVRSTLYNTHCSEMCIPLVKYILKFLHTEI